jgi:hypothetical protein
MKFVKGLALFKNDEKMQLMIVGCLWHNYKPRKVPFIASFQQKICDWIWVALHGRKANMKTHIKIPNQIVGWIVQVLANFLGRHSKKFGPCGSPLPTLLVFVNFYSMRFSTSLSICKVRSLGFTLQVFKSLDNP